MRIIRFNFDMLNIKHSEISFESYANKFISCSNSNNFGNFLKSYSQRKFKACVFFPGITGHGKLEFRKTQNYLNKN